MLPKVVVKALYVQPHHSALPGLTIAKETSHLPLYPIDSTWRVLLGTGDDEAST